jgi:hypothetical protein
MNSGSDAAARLTVPRLRLGLNSTNEELPQNLALPRGVLMMILRRKFMPLRNPDFVTATITTIDPGVYCFSAGLMQPIEFCVGGLFEQGSILVQGHDLLPLRM